MNNFRTIPNKYDVPSKPLPNEAIFDENTTMKKNKRCISLKKADTPPKQSSSNISQLQSDNFPLLILKNEVRKRGSSEEPKCSVKKSKPTSELLQDSFECFEDTQTLMKNNKATKRLQDDKRNDEEDEKIFIENFSHEFQDFFFTNDSVKGTTSKTQSTKQSECEDELISCLKPTQNNSKKSKQDLFSFSQDTSFDTIFDEPMTYISQKKNKNTDGIVEKAVPVSESHITSTMSPNSKPHVDFTQFCSDTQVLKQIDLLFNQPSTSKSLLAKRNSSNSSLKVTSTILSPVNKKEHNTIRTNLSPSNKEKKFINPTLPAERKIVLLKNKENQPVSSSTPFKKYPSDYWDESLNETICDAFKTSRYKKEVEQVFEQLQTTICNMGGNDSILNTSKDNIEELLEQTFKNPEMIKKVLETAEHSLRTNSTQNDWNGDSLLANAVINMSLDGNGFGSLIKKALIENMKNNVPTQIFTNVTILEEDMENRSLGPYYGLPITVKNLVKLYKGIDEMYDWQHEFLNLPAIKSRRNLVYALPTSGGKTLVAEILMLREVLCRKKNAIFILPYVAIVQEKVWSLSPFAVALEFLIEEYAAGKGVYPLRKRRRKNSVYIATIEKALGLLNSLIETGRTEEIGLIVVDELHLLGDKSRGPALEALLSKIIFLKEKIQIIGMSATIGNLTEICEFLHADIYTKDFRPVELVEYVKCGNEIARVEYNVHTEDDILVFDRKVNFKYAESLTKIDPDQLGGLVMEVIPNDSCLIFCRSKQNCENVAILLAKVVYSGLKNHKVKEKEALKNALKDEAGSLCNILKVSITYGIAYHHSGLTSEERRIIEEGFRQGVISVICCTSTLAAGVNLPAKRVIIRNPYIGTDFINLSRYKQMVGRAGRAGLGELGESILIAAPMELPRVRSMYMAPMDVAFSSLHENDGNGLRQFLLSCISLEMATTKSELQAITNQTLMGVQKTKLGIDLKRITRAAIRDLFKMGALQIGDDDAKEDACNPDITLKLDTTNITSAELESQNTTKKKSITITNDTKLKISRLGTAAIKGGLDLQRAHILYNDLMQAQNSLVLCTGLHLMYLVTPYDIAEQVKPSKAHYYSIYSSLGPDEIQTARVLGFNEAVAGKFLTNKKITEIPERILNRFYVTLMLYDLWNEMPLYEVSVKYEINRGVIQNLMTSAATFASNVYHYCEVFEEFWAFSLLLKSMSERLSHCCVKELIPLMQLPAVKQNRAKQLFQAGYKTLQSIAKADPNELVQSIEYMSKKLANQLIAAAKLILLEKVENLREEAEDVLDGIQM